MALDFSESYRATGPQPAYSPDGEYLATAVDYRVIVRDVDSLEVAAMFSCVDRVDQLEWAPAGDLLLAALHARGTTQVFSVADPGFSCRIDEGAAGLVNCRWCPDSRHVLATGEFNVRISVWSLERRECTYIRRPKFALKGQSFSPDAKFFAVAHREGQQDWMAIYGVGSWEVASFFQMATADVQDVSWSNEGATIAAIDSPLEPRCLIYSPQGEEVAKHEPPGLNLGFRCLSFSPTGQLLAIGGADSTMRILTSLTWNAAAYLEHPSKLKEPDHIAVYVEEIAEGRARYEVSELPCSIGALTGIGVKGQQKRQSCLGGIVQAAWSHDSRFLATRTEGMPAAVWIWDVARLELCSALIQKDQVRSFSWDPNQPRLAICTASDKVFLWAPGGASCVHVPLPGFSASKLTWHPSGQSFALASKDAFCCAFISE